MISRNYLALLAVGAGLFAGGPVMAADYDPPIFVDDAAEDYVPVEVGSGWYLRGDLAYTFDRGYNDTTFYTDGRTIDQDMASPARLGPLSINGFDVKENPVSGGVGFGYHFTDYLRGDLNFGLMGNDRFDADGRLFADTANAPPEFGCAGTQRTTVTDNASGASTVSVDPLARRDCAVTASGSVKAYNGMANGYVDLGTYSGLTPYIGAGVGMLYTRTKLDVNALCQTEDIAIDDGFATTRSQFLCQSPGDQRVAGLHAGAVRHVRVQFHVFGQCRPRLQGQPEHVDRRRIPVPQRAEHQILLGVGRRHRCQQGLRCASGQSRPALRPLVKARLFHHAGGRASVRPSFFGPASQWWRAARSSSNVLTTTKTFRLTPKA